MLRRTRPAVGEQKHAGPLEQIAAPHAPRVAEEPMRPFEPKVLREPRSPFLPSGQEIEPGTDAKRGAAGPGDRFSFGGDHLLLRRSDGDKSEAGAGSGDELRRLP